MPLENVTHISDLVATNPASGDPMTQGDDHIRNIKTAIKNDFPNITGAVTTTQAELNKLAGSPVTADDLTKLNSITVTADKINLLANVASDVQGQIDTINTTLTQKVDVSYVYSVADIDGLQTALDTLDASKLNNTGDSVSGGYTTTAYDLGTIYTGAVALDVSNGNIQKLANSGAITIKAPANSGDYTMIVNVTNTASAGAVTLTGFTITSGVDFDTVDTNSFNVHISHINGKISAFVEPLQ
ncbi:MAG: hypothetical protein IE937_01075 [Gammaproteobacteria bacterium]|nr:hypothetical protein [Gammaproteobacteria bacterium]